MVEGKFVDGDKPMVPAVIAWDQAVQTPYFILDTGFTGDLVVTPQVAKDLGLIVDGLTPIRTAMNKIEQVETATAIAVMEGATIYVTVFISDCLPLLGIGFLQKFNYTATVDSKNKTVTLSVSV